MRAAWLAASIALLAAVTMVLPAGAASAATETWTPTEAPGISATSTGNHLNAVDCWSPGNCVAVGYISNGSSLQSLIDEETDGTWSYVNQVSSHLDLTAVSCPADGACVAVGTVDPGTNHNDGELVVQSSSGWTTLVATGPNSIYTPSSFSTGMLTGVDCPAVNSCSVVGESYDTNETSTGFTLTLKPGDDRTQAASWTPWKAAEPPNDSQGGLTGVSCISAGDCTAVGFSYANGNAGLPVALIDNEKNYTWGYGGSPAPSGYSYGRLTSISCIPGGTVCMAGGNFLSNTGFEPAIVTVDTTDDTSSATPDLPAGFESAELDASSCAPDGQCQSVGEAYDKDAGTYYGYNGLIVSDRYGSSTQQPAPAVTASPPDANSIEHNENLNATSCVSGGFCVSVGSYTTDPDNAEFGVIDTRTYDSTGGITGESDITAPMPSTDSSSDDQKVMYGVRCNDSTHCAAVGSYFNDTDSDARGVIDTLGGSVTPPAAPTVTKISPTTGPTGGGNTVAVAGTDFTGATAVLFGSTAGTNVHVLSSTKLTVVAPKHGSGHVDIRVTTPGGTTAVTTADRYLYVNAPLVTKVSPASGSHKGGTVVVITGKYLSNTTSVRFGSAVSPKVKNVSDTRVDVLTPAHSTGTVDVEVFTAGGTNTRGTPDHFRYV